MNPPQQRGRSLARDEATPSAATRLVRRPPTVTIRRAIVGTSSYRKASKEVLVLGVQLSAGSRAKLVLVAIAVACFVAFDRLSAFAPLHLFAAGLGLVLVVYATGPIGAGRTTITVSGEALTLKRHGFRLRREQSIDSSQIVRLVIEQKHDETHLCAALANASTVLVAVVKTPNEAAFITQEIETYLGRSIH